MRRRPSASHVFIHADVLSERNSAHPHEKLPSLDDWQSAIDGDAWIEKSDVSMDADPVAEEEVRYAAVVTGNISDEAVVQSADAQDIADSRMKPFCRTI